MIEMYLLFALPGDAASFIYMAGLYFIKFHPSILLMVCHSPLICGTRDCYLCT